MPDISSIPGLCDLWKFTLGDSRVCVAVLDGPAAVGHRCFRGSNLHCLNSYWLDHDEEVDDGLLDHATHVCSVLFSPHNTGVMGLAPGCRGLSVPVQKTGVTNAYNVVRALDAARDAGADIIHVALVQPTQSGEADSMLQRAVRACLDEGILVISPAGNDSGECWTMPSAIPGVLAVGAMADDGQPLKFSNYGGVLQDQGVLAPGENILGADPDGSVRKHKGTSCAAPIVTGVAALLMSLQLQLGQKPSASRVRQAILDTAIPCGPEQVNEPKRCLRGRLNIRGAIGEIRGATTYQAAIAAPYAAMSAGDTRADKSRSSSSAISIPPVHLAAKSSVETTCAVRAAGIPAETEVAVSPAKKPLIYAIGTLNFDFGTESRRDTFRRFMEVDLGNSIVANPHDPRQMSAHLERYPSESRSLIWTLNQDQAPIYALEPVGSFGIQVYEVLRLILAGQVDASGGRACVERVSVPAERAGRVIRLFSGELVPVVKLYSPRGLCGWLVEHLIDDAIAAAAPDLNSTQEQQVRSAVRGFLDKVYHDMKNLGDTSRSRALNFAATNAFQVTQAFSEAIKEGRGIENFQVIKSPICRLFSDCWDLQFKFCDPTRGQRAKRVCRLTIDVSDPMPVTIGEVRSWLTRD